MTCTRCARLRPQNSVTQLPLEQAVDLVKDAFVSAGERDIYTVRIATLSTGFGEALLPPA